MIYEILVNNSKYYFDGNSFALYKDSLDKNQDVFEAQDNPKFYEMPERKLGKVLFLTTTNCNGKCAYCYEKNDFFGNMSPIMSVESANKALTYLQDKYDEIFEVSFFGGEPTLNFEVIKYIVGKLEDDFIVGTYDIVTNGVLFDDEIISFFEKYKFNITISIDGPEVIHDKLRENCLHKKVESTINKLKDTAIIDKVQLNCTFTRLHQDNISRGDLIGYFEDLGLQYNISKVITDIPWLKLKDYENKEKDIEEYIDDSYKRILENSSNKEISTFAKAIIEPLLYGICFDEFCCELSKGLSETFDTDGDRHPCSNLFKYDINDPMVKEYNSKNNKVCNQCWARNICKDCIAPYVLGEQKKPYVSGKCSIKKYYEYSLKRLIEILDESEEKFQLIVDNYEYFS